jgi:hypothetical protein
VQKGTAGATPEMIVEYSFRTAQFDFEVVRRDTHDKYHGDETAG